MSRAAEPREGLVSAPAAPVERLSDFFQQTGELVLLFVESLLWFRAIPKNRDKIAVHMGEIGVDTLPIATILALFTGGVLALQAGAALVKIGAGVNIGQVVGLSMVKELGPVLVSLLVAGRVGSAMAAEVGAMSVYEEIDALKTLNIDPVRFLVMPRLVASIITLPVLVLYADVLGWLGGAVVAAYNPNIRVPFDAYFNNLTRNVEFGDIVHGMVKAVAFGIIITIVCCYQGLRTTGGPREIARSTTRAVVLSFILVFIANYAITRILV